MNKKFLNIHMLISHSPCCLNRDDMNMQKSARFGGVRRVRVSSQCLKRAIRKSVRYNELFGNPSIRTRSYVALADKMCRNPKLEKYPNSIIQLVIYLSMDCKEVMIPWSPLEIEQLCELFQTKLENSDITQDDIDSFIKLALTDLEQLNKQEKNKVVKQLSEAKGKLKILQDALTKHAKRKNKPDVCSAVDLALSGRMAASHFLVEIDAALAMAHSITTHRMDTEIDWFTAMDDLQEDADETGAGHLNTQEFGSGVFYRYACIDLSLLADNLGETIKRSLAVASDFTELFTTVVPTGKQNTFASYSVADLALVSLSHMPLSAANAFEKPVEGKRGLIEPSIKALEEYWNKVHEGYGLNDKTAVFSLHNTTLTEKVNSLASLKTWIHNLEVYNE